VAYRIRKPGRDAWLGLEKFKCNKPNPNGGGDARTLLPTGKEISSTTNGPSDLLKQGSCEAPSAPSTSLLKSLLSKRGKNARQAPVDLAILNDSEKCQLPNKDVQVTSARNDGGSHKSYLQGSSSPTSHWGISTQIAMSAAEASGSPSLPQVPLKNSSPLPCILELFFTSVGQGSGSKSLGVAAARQVAREDLSTARAKELNKRSAIRKKSTTPTVALPSSL
jgi:hypothetical protein